MLRRSRHRPSHVPAVVVSLAMGAVVLAQHPDWPQWRGPARDGVAAFEAPATWPATLTRKWEAEVGLGHSSPVIADSRVIIHARLGTREITRAFDLESGRPLWQNAYDAPYEMNPAARSHGPGPKSTPAVAGGRVFTLGIGGVLSALDAGSGRVLWRVPASPVLPLYGTATSPLVDGGRVVVFMGGHDRGALTALDAATGAVVWRWAGDGPGYASPVVAEFGGVRQFVTQSQSKLLGVGAVDGALLWQVPLRTSFDQNSVTPLVVRDLVISSGLERPTIAWRITRGPGDWQAVAVWRNEQVSFYMSSPVVTPRAIVGLSHRNRGQFVALDPASGKTLWTTRGREGDNASIVRAGEWLLLSTTNGELIVARDSSARFEEVKRYVLSEQAIWAHPALVGRLIAVKDVDRLIVWEVRG